MDRRSFLNQVGIGSLTVASAAVGINSAAETGNTPPPDRIPSFPYLTLKAKSTSPEGPWIKQYDVTSFSVKDGSFYSVTASPGFIVKYKGKYIQFFMKATAPIT